MLVFSKQANSPLYAFNCFMTGLKMLARKELRKFLWIPVFINLCLYSAAFAWAYYYLTDLINFFIPDWLQWLAWIIFPVFFAIFFLMLFFTFTILANLIATPFYGKLAEKVLQLIAEETHGHEEGFSPPELVDVPLKTLLMGELKRLAYLLKWVVVLLIVSIIPVINLTAPIAWAIFGAWAIILEFLAYPLENQGLAFIEQKKLTQSVRFGSLTLGSMILFFLSVPLINLFISPAAVIAVTVYTYHGMEEKQEPKTSVAT